MSLYKAKEKEVCSILMEPPEWKEINKTRFVSRILFIKNFPRISYLNATQLLDSRRADLKKALEFANIPIN